MSVKCTGVCGQNEKMSGLNRKHNDKTKGEKHKTGKKKKKRRIKGE